MNPLERAIAIHGSQTSLAQAINTKQQNIWSWLNRGKRQVPAEFCAPIERATGGKVTRKQLRPDISWGRA